MIYRVLKARIFILSSTLVLMAKKYFVFFLFVFSNRASRMRMCQDNVVERAKRANVLFFCQTTRLMLLR